MIGTTNPNHLDQTSICSKLVKADLNGAKVTVVKNKNPCMLGLTGIVVRETVRSLITIDEENVIKTLLK